MCFRRKLNDEDVDLTESAISELRCKRTIAETKVYDVEVNDEKLPIVYHSAYNIHCFGVEKMHPFDSQKWGNVVDRLILERKLKKSQIVQPREVTREDLRVVHSPSYLKSLGCSAQVAGVVEIPFVACIPNFVVNRVLLKPMRFQTGGTILAARIAIDRQFAINIGGGFHHASALRGGGFCVYADITLALRFLFAAERIQRAMIVDLDAHQGNGHENDFAGDDRVFIFDMFNYQIYPGDFKAKESINCAVRLETHTSDREYLHKLQKNLTASLNSFTPDLIVYNAGTDVLAGDPLGRLDLSAVGVVSRDEMVFKEAAERSIPIVMVTSGGYTTRSAQVIADSISNLLEKFIAPLESDH